MITKKDDLAKAIRHLASLHGSVYDFVPETFIVPTEYPKFVAAYTKGSSTLWALSMHFSLHGSDIFVLCLFFVKFGTEGGSAAWICKPNDLSRGRKIFLFREISQLVVDQQALVQKVRKGWYRPLFFYHGNTAIRAIALQYIERPLLIGGYKFDLRIYVILAKSCPVVSAVAPGNSEHQCYSTRVMDLRKHMCTRMAL